jgi:hypothetical protein
MIVVFFVSFDDRYFLHLRLQCFLNSARKQSKANSSPVKSAALIFLLKKLTG